MSDSLRLHYLQAMPKLEQVWCFQLSITRCSLPRVLSFIWFMRSNLVPGWALFGLQQTLGPFVTLKAQQTTSTDLRVCVLKRKFRKSNKKSYYCIVLHFDFNSTPSEWAQTLSARI